MSVYSMGKIVCLEEHIERLEGALKILAQESRVDVTIGLLDQEDDSVFLASPLLKRPGVVFNIFTPGDSDIATLWEEAAGAARHGLESAGRTEVFRTWHDLEEYRLPDQVGYELQQTRLGNFVSGLFTLQNLTAGSFSVFDNGIDQVIEGEPDDCKDLIFKTFLLNWDMGPNALFVWKARI
jgi:hypothetical protein